MSQVEFRIAAAYSRRRWALTLITLLAMALVCGVVGPAFANPDPADPTPTDESQPDQVWIDPERARRDGSDWYPRPIVQRSVRIVEFGAEAIKFIEGGGDEEQRLAAGRVLWVERGTASKHETKGLQLFAEQRYAESLPALIDAIGTRPPVWHQQWLSMVAAQAAWRSGRAKMALELVGQVDRLPFPPLVLAWMPIQWDSSAPSPEMVDAASARLANSSPAVQLVAASWLLSTKRGQASQVLRFLGSDSSRPDVARLAEFVVRRTSPPPEAKERVEQWQDEIESLPIVLQVGPSIMLMHKLQTSGLEKYADRVRLGLKLTPPHPHPEIMELEDPEEGLR